MPCTTQQSRLAEPLPKRHRGLAIEGEKLEGACEALSRPMTGEYVSVTPQMRWKEEYQPCTMMTVNEKSNKKNSLPSA
jgi:hypothetical protein